MKKTWSRVLATVLVLAMVLCMPGFAASVADTMDFESDRATSADELTDADLPELLSASGNHYPIVLVHGLFGWGGTEVLGLNYWGGFSSLRDILNNAGYKVYTPSIGPVASNWDRACELYAYLVGGTVDYGAYHSATNGHARYGRTFPGVLPELNNPDSELKVHLVGHSMGGETIRMLAQLLENGDADERNASRGGDISPLFTGECRHWIESITTLCTPHDGSQYDTKVYQNIGDLAQYAMGIIGAVTGTNVNENNFGLDFKLDQWGLVRQPNESYSSYFNRVINSKIWTQHTNDLSVYDLDVDGAAVLNGYAKAQDDIYYFSVACSNTHREPLTGHYLPNASMNPMMVKSSTYMGRHVNYAVGHVNITPDWWENDGIVSVRSAIRPHENSTDKYNENYGVGADGKMTFKAGTKMGVWNYIEKIDNTDHINMVGQMQKSTHAMLQEKFFELAKMLNSIPVSSSTGAHVCPGAHFTDMPAYTNWAHKGLDYCIQNGILNGTSATTIAPNGTTTRAQLVTMLYRQAGSPKAAKSSPFTDVTDSWSVDAVNWAFEKGVVNGTSPTTFSPNDAITRQDMAIILYNYTKNVLDLDVYDTADLTGYPDYSSISDYARTPLSWAVAQGLILGVGNSNGVDTLQPKGDAPRAQTATIIMRFCQNVL